MTRFVYDFKSSAHISRKKLDPQACGEFLASLPSSQPADVVEASRDESAPTHPHFSWDITADEAKQRVWEQEAGQLVRAIVIVQHEDEPLDPPLPAFVSITRRVEEDRSDLSEEEPPRSYMQTYEALSDEDYRLQVLAEAKAALFAWRRRYHELQELARVFEAIDQLTLDQAA